jgi:hypothetical protein
MLCLSAKNVDNVGGIRSRCRCCESFYCHWKTTQQFDVVRLPTTCKNETTRQRTFNEVKDVLLEKIFEVMTGSAGLTWSAWWHTRCACHLRAAVLIMCVSATPTAGTPFTTLLH